MNLIEQLEEFQVTRGLSRKQLAGMMGLSVKTIAPWLSRAKSGYKPGKENLKRIEQFLVGKQTPATVELEQQRKLAKEAEGRSAKIRYLLLLLEDELRWFRDALQPEAREVLRKEIYFNDVGYISSLLSMLGDEEMFQRWKTLTNYQFKGLRMRRGKDGNRKD